MYINRKGETVEDQDVLNRFLERIYAVPTGRLLMRQLCNRRISEMAGRAMNSRWSRKLIAPFIRKNGIDMNLYEDRDFNSYNDFFTRKSAPHVRRFSEHPEDFCAPCDGKLTVVPISDETVFRVKGTRYTTESLLRYRRLASKFSGGTALIFRLSVDNYHRYAYFDHAWKSKNYRIPGRFYSVDPAVLSHEAVFKENEREYCILKTEHFGTCVYMEVGAMMVGRIVNRHQETVVHRGEEKGYFEFGGSTIILLLEKDAVNLLPEYRDASCEVEVRMGDIIGTATRTEI